MTSQTFCPQFKFRRCQDPVGMQPRPQGTFPWLFERGGKGEAGKRRDPRNEIVLRNFFGDREGKGSWRK